MSTLAEGVIAPGDLVAVIGFPEFFRALVPALDNAVGVTLADWDHRPDIHLDGDGISFPKQPGRAPVPVPEDTKPRDERVYVFYAGPEARNGAHLRQLATVVLEATSTTAARVLKAGGMQTEGVGLKLIDGKPVVSRAPFAGRSL
jgi:hypothetical protein